MEKKTDSEPVALPERKVITAYGLTALDHEAEGWNACLDEIAKLGPLYTHADPGEVERLRAKLANKQSMSDNYCALLMDANQKLAERDALLRKALASCDEATAAFENDPNGPGQWTCHACFSECKPVWRHGHIIAGGPNQIEHMADCWAEQARKLLSTSAEPGTPCPAGSDCCIDGHSLWCPNHPNKARKS